MSDLWVSTVDDGKAKSNGGNSHTNGTSEEHDAEDSGDEKDGGQVNDTGNSMFIKEQRAKC
jgi:hypothetical protein